MANKDDYLTEYRQFFEEFANTVEPNDQLPVKLGSYKFINSEVVGGIVDWCLQYLNRKSCPSTLVGPLIKITIEEIRMACKKHPVACGFNPIENVYEPLKLMQTVMSKVNEVCLRYLDNAQLDTLPTPPTVAPPPVSTCASRNTRRRMEDRHVVIHDINGIFNIPDTSPTSYYAIFDGHAGPDAASYSAAHLHQFLVESEFYPTDPERALKEAFLRTDEFFLEKSKIENFRSGTTAVCALLRPKEETLYVAWVGDSQALLVNRGKVLQIVKPHKPCREDEKDRIEANGGCVMFWGMWRVNGQLAVSRAIGDLKLKPYVTAEPDIVAVPLDGNEEFLIIACDGLWDFVSEDDAAIAVYNRIKENPDNIDTIAESLSDLAKQEGSRDNISIIIIFLKDPSKIAKKFSTDWGWPSVQTTDVTMETGVDNTNINNTASNNAFDLFGVFQKRGLDHFASEQPEFNKSNGTDQNKSELYHFDRPSNGKRRVDDEFDEDEEDDFGPETDVDGVDDVLLSPMIASAKAMEKVLEGNENNNDDQEKMDTMDVDIELQKQQSSEFEPSREAREETPTPPADSVLDSSGLADNVAESEDSEDEWNYYRVDPKEKDNTVPPLETNNKVSPATPPHDDMSQLNPDAKEFVPVSPTRTAVSPAPYSRDLVDDALIAQSPRRAVPMDISVPSANEFQLEVKQRPSELFDDEFEAENTTQNGHQLSSQEIMQNLLNGKDVSEIEFHPSSYAKPASETYFGNNLAKNLIENETENSKENISPSEEQPTESSLSPIRDESDFASFVPKPQDPMSMSFYQDKDDEIGFSTNPFDLNKVQLLPEDVDEFIQPTKEEMEVSPAQSPLGVPLSPELPLEEPIKTPEPSEASEAKSPVPIEAISPAECMMSKSPLLEVSRSPLPGENKPPVLEIFELATKSFLLEVETQENKSLLEIANSPTGDVARSPSPLCEVSESLVCEVAESPMEEISPSPVCEIAKSASPIGEISPSPVCEIAKSPFGNVSESLDIAKSASPVCDFANPPFSQSPVCGVAKSPFEEISQSPVCDIAKSASPVTEISQSLVCEIAKSPFGDVSQSPVCEVAKSPFGNVSESPVCDIVKSASPVCEIPQSPVCEVAKSPLGDVSQSPVCDIAKSASPVCEISQSPVCEVAKSPLGDISQSPICDIAKSASPVCEISQSPVCEIAKSSLLELGKTPEISQSPICEISKSPMLEISQPVVCEISKSPILDVHSPMELSSPVGPLSPKSPIPELTGLVSPDITASIKDENISGEISETPKSTVMDDVHELERILSPIAKSPFDLTEEIKEIAKSPFEISEEIKETARSPFEAAAQIVQETRLEFEEQSTKIGDQIETISEIHEEDKLQELISDMTLRSEHVLTPKSPELEVLEVKKKEEINAQDVVKEVLENVTNEMHNLINETENINNISMVSTAPSEIINLILEHSVVPEVTSPLSPVEKPEKYQTERPESWKENLEIKCETIKPEFAIHTMTSPSEESKGTDTPPPPPTPSIVVEEPELKRGSPEPGKLVQAVEKLETVVPTEVRAKIAPRPAPPKTTSTTKKPLPSANKQLAAKTSATTLKKSPTTKTQLTPRSAAKSSTPITSPRTTTTTKTTPKPATPTTTTSRLTPKPAEKKPLTNGDVKPAAKTTSLKKTTVTSTASKTASAPSAANKASSVSSATKLSVSKPTQRASSGSTTKPAAPRTTTAAAKPATAGTVPPKPRPASLTAKPTTTTSATTKSAISRPATTGTIRSTTTTTARAKPTTTTTTSAARPRPITSARPATKAPDTEKQIKETANKQLSAARTTTSRTTTTTTAAAAAKTTSAATRKIDTKTSLASRTTRTTTTTLKSTTKKPTEVTKTTVTSTKKAVTKPAAEQNGVVNVIQEITTTIISDDPQLLKDNSPVENIEIDNSKLAEIIAD